ncbi:MAG: cytidylate kinase-like family protein [Spirochaetes bacterium]|nr:cytidylate kinase-like family protein [Spirochaetota bacterium]
MPYKSMEKYINSQVTWWRQQKAKIDKVEKKSIFPFITISREYGCGGYELALKLIEILNTEHKHDPLWAAYDRQLLERVMEDMGLSSSLTETLTNKARADLTNLIQTSFSTFPPQVVVYRKLVETIRILAYNGNVVIVGRAGNVITKDMENGFNVRLVAAMDWKVERIRAKLDLTRQEAEKIIIEKEKTREEFMEKYVRFRLSDPHNYDIFINNTNFTMEQAARLIIEGMKIKGLI